MMDEPTSYLIQLLWGEIPLGKEADTLRMIRDQGLYELWEESFDWADA